MKSFKLFSPNWNKTNNNVQEYKNEDELDPMDQSLH
jgi:hypothetical protein